MGRIIPVLSNPLPFLLCLCVLLFLFGSCSGAVGGPCDSSCNDTLNCCNDQFSGLTCFDTGTHDCVSDKQICAANLSLCYTTCYDSAVYDCVSTKLCPIGYQLCGDQCYDPDMHACVQSSNTLRAKNSAECGELGYNTQINECLGGVIGPIRDTSPCATNQELCGQACYDPMLYGCANNQLYPLPGFCGKGQVWCSALCYDPSQYVCVEWLLINYVEGSPCPNGQVKCGNSCYNPSTLSCLTGDVICSKGMSVCDGICYNASRYSCVNSQVIMNEGFCAPGSGLCGQRCYNKTQFSCKNNDLLVPTAPSTTCATNPCLSSDGCCSDAAHGTVCYDTEYYACKSSPSGTTKLCGNGLGLCGTRCYDSTIYNCFNNNNLCPSDLDYCAYTKGCYDKSKNVCFNSTVLCPLGYMQCGDVCVSQSKYTCSSEGEIEICSNGKEVCNGECYDVSKYVCVNDTIVEAEINSCVNATCPYGSSCVSETGNYTCKPWKFFIRSTLNNFVLTFKNEFVKGSAIVLKRVNEANRSSQHWSFTQDGYIYHSQTGLVLDIENGVVRTNMRIIAWTKKPLPKALNQRFKYYNTTNLLSTLSLYNIVFDVKDGSTKEGAQIITWGRKTSKNQNQLFELDIDQV